MATRVIGAERRSLMRTAAVALVLAAVVFLLAAQATSIWSTDTGSVLEPAPVHAVTIEDVAPWVGTDIHHRCRVKVGCPTGGSHEG